MYIFNLAKFVLAVGILGMSWQQAASQEVIGNRGISSNDTMSISYQIQGDWEISGLQFDVNYDPSTHLPSLDRCLAGLPDSHKGAFATCKALPEKSMVRVVVMDLGRNRLLPSGSVLGTISFQRAAKSALSASSSSPSVPTVANVVLGNAAGKASDAPVDKAFKTFVAR